MTSYAPGHVYLVSINRNGHLVQISLQNRRHLFIYLFILHFAGERKSENKVRDERGAGESRATGLGREKK